MKLGKHQESQDLLTEIKPHNQREFNTVRYLVFIFTAFSMNADATRLLENVQGTHGERAELGEQLFFAYVRESKLLKQ